MDAPRMEKLPFMTRSHSFVQQLMPAGTTGGDNWDNYPDWPPDLFAVTASLARNTSCYLDSKYTGFDGAHCFYDSSNFATSLIAAVNWRNSVLTQSDDEHISGLWKTLIESSEDQPDWKDSVMSLLAIADEASAGIGYSEPKPSGFAELYRRLHEHLHLIAQNQDSPSKGIDFGFMSHLTCCRQVDSSQCVVQPKLLTPQVGLTLRSFSHHLALLPSVQVVQCPWRFGPRFDKDDLNLLLVPFPFSINAIDFVEGPPCGVGTARDVHHFFSLEQSWLRSMTPEQLVAFVVELCEEVANTGSVVDGVILPELSIDYCMVECFTRCLAQRVPSVKFFIAGVHNREENQNAVYTAVFDEGKVYFDICQPKHHRWKIEKEQIITHGLPLSQEKFWWENTAYSSRILSYFQLGGKASFTSLICEDLARVEPVHEVLRAVGANLVICLLMDGAQKISRWSGRYATGLADDPGSSVLTFTSLGLMKQSPKFPGSNGVALWKQQDGYVKEISLNWGVHALLLELEFKPDSQHCVDGRTDGGSTGNVHFKDCKDVVHPAPPSWLG